MSVAMARRAALAPGFLRFLLRPPVGRSFFMSSLAAFAGDLALLARVHPCEAASTFGHDASLDRQPDGTFLRRIRLLLPPREWLQLICLTAQGRVRNSAAAHSSASLRPTSTQPARFILAAVLRNR